MSDFPNTIYNPRAKENIYGVVFDTANKKMAYAEDFQFLDNEVVAIENELGINIKGVYLTLRERIEKMEIDIFLANDTLEPKANKFEIVDFSNFTASKVGSGSNIKTCFRLKLATGTTINSNAIAYLKYYNYGNAEFSFDESFRLIFFITQISGVLNANTFLKVDNDINPVNPSSKAIGFKLNGYKLFGIIHNGTSLQEIDLTKNLNANGKFKLEIKFFMYSKIEFYVNDVKRGESQNIPNSSMTNSNISVSVANNAVASNQEIAVGKIYLSAI